MKILKVFLVLALICSAYGCAGMNSTEQSVLSGGAIGTAAGLGAAAVIGAPLLVGVAAGAAAGAVGGYVVDEIQRH
jgi:ABC-type dipeptide/oligopeptide/nickel transport system permease subunit